MVGGWAAGGWDFCFRLGCGGFCFPFHRQAQDEMGAGWGWLGAGRLGCGGFVFGWVWDFCFPFHCGADSIRRGWISEGLGLDFQLAAGLGLGWAGAVLLRFIVV